MANRKPLVINLSTGQIEQLQAGDTLDAIVTCGEQMTLNAATSFLAGQVGYISNANEVSLAKASALATSRAIGVAVIGVPLGIPVTLQTSGNITLTTGEWDIITGQIGGLTAGVEYYLSASADGMIVPLADIIGYIASNYVVKIGIAISSTTLDVYINEPIKL